MTRRTQRSWIQAITSTYIWKSICRIEIFKSNFKPALFKEVTRGNKWPTPKAEKYIRQLDFIQNYVNYNVYTRGCPDSNVRIMLEWFIKLNVFFLKVNLIKWYFLGLVNLEKKSTCVEGSPACLSSPGQANFNFHSKLVLGQTAYIKKWKVGLARRETWLALPGYPFWL